MTHPDQQTEQALRAAHFEECARIADAGAVEALRDTDQCGHKERHEQQMIAKGARDTARMIRAAIGGQSEQTTETWWEVEFDRSETGWQTLSGRFYDLDAARRDVGGLLHTVHNTKLRIVECTLTRRPL